MEGKQRSEAYHAAYPFVTTPAPPRSPALSAAGRPAPRRVQPPRKVEVIISKWSQLYTKSGKVSIRLFCIGLVYMGLLQFTNLWNLALVQATFAMRWWTEILTKGHPQRILRYMVDTIHFQYSWTEAYLTTLLTIRASNAKPIVYIEEP